ncbi:MAG TPA: hypothetical protein VM914_03145 [Pyrinomonadaceae bacterium]|nr:hypothetical protein [Pyrinomonadaceae bacterium]
MPDRISLPPVSDELFSAVVSDGEPFTVAEMVARLDSAGYWDGAHGDAAERLRHAENKLQALRPTFKLFGGEWEGPASLMLKTPDGPRYAYGRPGVIFPAPPE